MKKELLNLASAQLYQLCSSICQIQSSDKRKEDFRQRLTVLTNQFMTLESTTLPDQVCNVHHSILKIYQQIATVLDPNNKYILSKEMRYVLGDLLSTWIPDASKYIICATDGDFAITKHYHDWNALNMITKQLYNVEFGHQLITFYVPKHLTNDFFYAGVLYHEMGHFIDSYYNVYVDVTNELKQIMQNPSEKAIIINSYFPQLNNHNIAYDHTEFENVLTNHCKEMIADLFGAQYLEKEILSYLKYICYPSFDKSSNTHPAPNIREQIVSDFINDNNNVIIDLIKNSFNNNGLNLAKKYTDLNIDPSADAITFNNNDELHSLIYSLWITYYKGKVIINPGMSNYDFYTTLNQIAHNSIKQYFGI